MVGGADKWPIHFYWTNLAVRVGGKPAFEAALRGENGGFEGETFIKSGSCSSSWSIFSRFQNGFLGFRIASGRRLRRRQGSDDASDQHRLSPAARACRR